MIPNDDYPVGLHSLYPSGTNSTFFTLCCNTAICDDQANCPGCGRKVVGHDEPAGHERHRRRWNHAYVRETS